MSLASDFGMYYRNTYIGYRTSSGRVLPFYVQEVHGGGSNYDEASMASLNFQGVVYYDDRETTRQVRLDSNKLVLELPELGYVFHRNRPIWLSYRPIQQASKGVSGRRVVGAMMNNQLAKAIYKALHDQPDHLARQFYFADGIVMYKGRNIGTYENEDQLSLVPAAAYLVPYVNKAFPNKTVEVAAQ